MNKNQIYQALRKDIQALDTDKRYQRSSQRFFKKKVKIYGFTTPRARQLAAKYLPLVKKLEKNEVWDLAEKLLRHGYQQDHCIAFAWIAGWRKKYTESDWQIFFHWLDKYANNWGSVDDFSTHALGYFLIDYPAYLSEMKKWAKNRNPWVRRAAAVSLVFPLRRKVKCLDLVWEVADRLMGDEEDLVQKGYGWMLKVASEYYPKPVFDYVQKNKRKMTRTALRYAIEKMPVDWRRQALS